jgi:hypothetical protein
MPMAVALITVAHAFLEELEEQQQQCRARWPSPTWKIERIRASQRCRRQSRPGSQIGTLLSRAQNHIEMVESFGPLLESADALWIRNASAAARHARPRLLSCPSSSWHPSPRRMGRWQSRVRVGTSDHTWSRIWSSTAVSAHALASNHPSSSWRPHLSPVVVSDSAVDSGVCVALHRFDAVAIVTSHCLCAAVSLRRKIPSAPACATRAARTARPTCSR